MTENEKETGVEDSTMQTVNRPAPNNLIYGFVRVERIGEEEERSAEAVGVAMQGLQYVQPRFYETLLEAAYHLAYERTRFDKNDDKPFMYMAICSTVDSNVQNSRLVMVNDDFASSIEPIELEDEPVGRHIRLRNDTQYLSEVFEDLREETRKQLLEVTRMNIKAREIEFVTREASRAINMDSVIVSAVTELINSVKENNKTINQLLVSFYKSNATSTAATNDGAVKETVNGNGFDIYDEYKME